MGAGTPRASRAASSSRSAPRSSATPGPSTFTTPSEKTPERIAESGLEPKIAMELASIEVIKRLVQLGFGVSIVPAISVQQELAAGTLVARHVLPRSQRRKLGAVHPERGPLPPAAQAFLDLARAILAGDYSPCQS